MIQDQPLSKGEQERLERLRASKLRKLKLIFIWVLVLGIVGGAGYWLVDWARNAESRKPGTRIEDMGAVHIESGQESGITYNSNPPTSGPHYPKWAEWGVHDEVLPDQLLIHNLEHGGIWISYHNAQDKDLVEKLKNIVKKYTVKVVLTPRPQNDSEIALAAWGRLLKLERFDEKKIKDFIKAFINKGPEQVPF